MSDDKAVAVLGRFARVLAHSETLAPYDSGQRDRAIMLERALREAMEHIAYGVDGGMSFPRLMDKYGSAAKALAAWERGERV